MKKEECIKKYGKEVYAKQQEQTRDWQYLHPMRVLEIAKEWADTHPAEEEIRRTIYQ